MQFTEEQNNYFNYIADKMLPLYRSMGNDKLLSPATNIEWNLKKLRGQVEGEILDIETYASRTKSDFTAVAAALPEGDEGRVFAEKVVAEIDAFFGIAPPEPVDMTAALSEKAAANSEDLNWQHSIVDLLKLLGKDSSSSARKGYALALGFPEEQLGKMPSAEFNMWLHGQLLNTMACNQGEWPSNVA